LFQLLFQMLEYGPIGVSMPFDQAGDKGEPFLELLVSDFPARRHRRSCLGARCIIFLFRCVRLSPRPDEIGLAVIAFRHFTARDAKIALSGLDEEIR